MPYTLEGMKNSYAENRHDYPLAPVLLDAIREIERLREVVDAAGLAHQYRNASSFARETYIQELGDKLAALEE